MLRYPGKATGWQAGCTLFNLVSCGRWFDRTRKPQRPPQAIWSRSGSRLFQPFLINFVRFVGVDKNITVFVFRTSTLDRNFLVPAMHSADWIWLHRESHILMNARILPPDAL